MPRNLIIRFIKSGEPAPRAVATFIDKIPPEEFEEIKKWALYGKGKYAKTRFGTIRKILFVNIVVTPSEERINDDGNNGHIS